MKTIHITNPPKPWWPGDVRVEPFMKQVNEALDRAKLPRENRTDIYNRAYEAVYHAICKYASE